MAAEASAIKSGIPRDFQLRVVRPGWRTWEREAMWTGAMSAASGPSRMARAAV